MLCKWMAHLANGKVRSTGGEVMQFSRLGRLLTQGGWAKQPVDKFPPIPEVLEHARQDWVYAQKLCNDVTDEDLIEYAIYLMKSSEKKYSYLLKQARRAGVINKQY